METKLEAIPEKTESKRSESYGIRMSKIKFDQENIYETTCGSVDRRCIEYGVKISICFSVMIFSMVKLMLHDDEDKSVWIALLSSIVGNFLPSIGFPTNPVTKK